MGVLKALISGIDGFTGRYLAAELRLAGFEVFGLAYKPLTMEINGVKSVYACDLCDSSGLVHVVSKVQPDVVAHLAALSFVAHADVEEIYRVNLIGSRNFLEAVALCGKPVNAVLLPSSANVYGNATGQLLDETTPPAPTNDYAVSKLAMEYVARLYSDRLPIVISRPFNYTGAGQSLSFILPKVVDHFKRRCAVLELGNLNVVRDFSDVRWVVKCYRMLLEAGVSGEIYNICSGQGYSLLEVVQMMREVSGHDLDVRVNPAFVRKKEVHHLIGSGAKLSAAIGPVPNIRLRDTLAWMLESP